MKKSKSQSKALPARSWIEATFHGRECIRFIPNPKLEMGRCRCGRLRIKHSSDTVDGTPDEIWNPQLHTKTLSTNAFGTIEFQGGPHPSKAQYVRLSYDSRPELLLQLFMKEWSLELPKLLITVQGGRSNFELQPKLKKILRKGLLKAAKTAEAWIFTGGLNTGATRHVGDALLSERAQRTGRVVSLGIAPWGIVQDNEELIGMNKDVQYHSISLPRSRFLALNSRLTHFLLVDNGTEGQFGGDIWLRRKVEKYISDQKLHPYTHSSIPVVCLVIEGGTNAIRAVLEYVTDNPPVPVVVCDGSGRAADLIAFVHKHASDSGEEPKLDEQVKDYLKLAIETVFEVTKEKAECLYDELLQCCRKKKLITIFRISERTEAKSQELDQAILTALFKSENLTPFEQLSLSLMWNRVDIARSEIFVYGQEWPQGALDQAMMQALEHDRTDFVKLLLENGVTMRKFLTIPRLEELYNTRQAPNVTLGYVLRDIRPHIQRGYVYTLHDIGLVINKLMGGAYRAFYTRRKFRPIYAKVMNKSTHIHRNSSSNMKYCGNALSLLTEALPSSSKIKCVFDYPFNELLIWAVLLKRQKMALLMWQHGEEALAKALAACKLYKAMAHEAAEDDMETEIYEELRAYAKEFENIALELLDYCYRQDDDLAQQLLTCELLNWSEQTCLSLAVAGNHRPLLAHPCSQIILADLWMGGLRTRKNTNLKVVLGLLFPPYILQLEFKSKEELQLMPQTVEEHTELKNDDDDKSVSEKNVDAESLLGDEFYQRDTIVQENGKVMPDKDEVKYHFPIDTAERRHRPLKVKKKIYEFFTAPITKFWANSIAYLLFLLIFSYTVLVKMGLTPTWQEYLAISYICGLACEKIRELLSTEPVAIKHKLILWTWNMWNPCDATAIIFFFVALTLRLQANTMEIGRLMYCVNSIYWYLRILNILGVNKYLGPLVTMMGKMVKNMIYFVVLLLVVLMSFGVCRQAILFPNNEASWNIARDVFFEPYFMLYGEVFADGIDPPCGGPGNPCLTGRWLTPAVMAIYLLIANILLINLLIAVFNNIFNEVNAISHQVWMFQRFTVVMEYEQKPILPPPFILLCHIYLVFKYFKRLYNGSSEPYDNGLKLFLEKEDMERLYDFEEECVEGYFAEQEYKLQQSTEDRIRVTTERVENIVQKVEDINTKENSQTSSMQSVEFRLRKVEEASQDILEHLAVIHRFMASHSNDELPPIIPPDRIRKTSDRSETSDDSHLSLPQPTRRRLIRSFTEVRPSTAATFYDDAIQMKTQLMEEDEELSERTDDRVSKASSSTSDNEVDEVLVDAVELEAQAIEGAPSKHASAENLATLAVDQIRPKSSRRRDSAGSGRRSSEGGNGKEVLIIGPPLPWTNQTPAGEESVHGSKRSLTRRQISQTHSEPDTSEHAGLYIRPRSYGAERSVKFAEPRIKVIPPTNHSITQANPRSMLVAMHEYTSITDELESMCGLLSPPKTPRLLSPPRPGQSAADQTKRKRCASEMSNPEMALFIEKEHLRDAEECDYDLMENLIQTRNIADEEDSDEHPKHHPSLLHVVHESREYRSQRSLRRASAFEDEIFTPIYEPPDSLMEATQEKQDSFDSYTTNEMASLINQQLPQRPSIVIDSSQLPIQKEAVKKADSKSSLHMQSETMC